MGWSTLWGTEFGVFGQRTRHLEPMGKLLSFLQAQIKLSADVFGLTSTEAIGIAEVTIRANVPGLNQ